MESPNDRKGRIEAVEKYIEDEKELEKTKLISQMSYELGVTEEKAEEYLETLKGMEKVNEKDGNILHAEA